MYQIHPLLDYRHNVVPMVEFLDMGSIESDQVMWKMDPIQDPIRFCSLRKNTIKKFTTCALFLIEISNLT